jgi:hypothetical protein
MININHESKKYTYKNIKFPITYFSTRKIVVKTFLYVKTFEDHNSIDIAYVECYIPFV